MRTVGMILAIFIAVTCVASFASQDPLIKFFPDSGFKGWTLIKDSHLYGKGSGLTEVYDGGYKEYLDAGVLEASKQTYKNATVFADLTIHRMKSPASAKAFYDKQLKLAGKQAVEVNKPFRAFTWITGGGVYAHLIFNEYYISSALTNKDAEASLALMTETARKIGASVKKK